MSTHSSAARKPRIHRLPIRTDYILIPAPLDLSLPEIAQKSPLPPIIVTPCSPSSTHDFSLAFLPNPPKATLRERIQRSFSSSASVSSPLSLSFDAHPLGHDEPKLFPISFTTSSSSSSGTATHGSGNPNRGTLRTRSILAILLVSFLALCHIITHRLAVRMNKPYIEFAVQNMNGGDGVVGVHGVGHGGYTNAHAYGVGAGKAPVYVQGHDIHPGLGLGRGGLPGPMISNWFGFRSKIGSVGVVGGVGGGVVPDTAVGVGSPEEHVDEHDRDAGTGVGTGVGTGGV